MIKLVLGDNDNPEAKRLLLLGLTAEDMLELTQGHPILVNPGEAEGLGIGRVAIYYGVDQAALLQDVREQLGIEVPDVRGTNRPAER